MSITEKSWEVSRLPIEFEHEALVITVSHDYKSVLNDWEETASHKARFLIFRKKPCFLLKKELFTWF